MSESPPFRTTLMNFSTISRRERSILTFNSVAPLLNSKVTNAERANLLR